MLENDNNDIFLSIIVPCYNCQSTLRRTVDSLLAQKKNNTDDYCNYQIILVDDGSTDDTYRICDEYVSEYQNVLSIHQQNGGLVKAWKAGVNKAEGRYIAFCDSDDCIELDFVDRIFGVAKMYKPELIVFGMTIDYDNGDVVQKDTFIQEGFYDINRVHTEIFPVLLSNGDMQTAALLPSRCNKVFDKQLLLRIMDDVPDNISFGEDEVTCFSTALNMNSVYCIKAYYPYHYIRNTESMIGAYDERVFLKIEFLYATLKEIAQKYEYLYSGQVEGEILSLLLLFFKKEICRNQKGRIEIIQKLDSVRDSEIFIDCSKKASVKKYSFSKRVFAYMVMNRWYGLVFMIVKTYEAIRGRNV